ncbi:MAG TPA: hypothetical protein VNN80_24840 [Polyangiaceae bacterium]|jgi:hypothetical protein|nr:hypothetical protein [Polyangiaceae bacterium]
MQIPTHAERDDEVQPLMLEQRGRCLCVDERVLSTVTVRSNDLTPTTPLAAFVLRLEG